MARFLVVGAAHIHMKDLLLAMDLLPGTEILGIYDDNPEHSEYWAERFDSVALSRFDDLPFGEVDGIFVYSETSKHLEILQKLPADKPVFIEKPLGIGSEDAEAILEILQQRQQVFHCGYLMRCLESLPVMKRFVGDLGDIERVEGSFVHAGLKAGVFQNCSWMIKNEYTGGIGGFGDLLVHLIDATEFVLGEHLMPIASIIQYDPELAEADIAGTAVLSIDSENAELSGVQVVLRASISEDSHSVSPIHLKVVGSNGYLEYVDGKLELCNQSGKCPALLVNGIPGAEFPVLAFLSGVTNRNYSEFVDPADASRQAALLEAIYDKGNRVYRKVSSSKSAEGCHS